MLPFLPLVLANQLGSWKDAQTCLTSFLVSSSPGTADSSLHQSGVLHIWAFHMTHPAKSKTAGSSGACPHPHHLMSLVTPMERRPLQASAPVGLPGWLCPLQVPPHLMASQGWQID